MSKYIDADKLIANIESIINSDHPIEYELMEKRAYDSALSDVIDLIASLQQEQPEPFSCGHANGSEPKPEVDLERDAVQFCFDKGLNVTPYQAKTIARHFYELGLNARKEE